MRNTHAPKKGPNERAIRSITDFSELEGTWTEGSAIALHHVLFLMSFAGVFVHHILIDFRRSLPA
jgi:hypothetical protein